MKLFIIYLKCLEKAGDFQKFHDFILNAKIILLRPKKVKQNFLWKLIEFMDWVFGGIVCRFRRPHVLFLEGPGQTMGQTLKSCLDS